MQWLVLSKNNLFFGYLVFGYIFGIMLYDVFSSKGFTYIDELMAAFSGIFILIICIERKNSKDLKPLIITTLIFIGYLLYSLLIKNNTTGAIIKDAIIQYKPYLSFFATLALRPQLNREQKLFLVILSLTGAAFLISIASISYYSEFFGHPSRFATAAVITAFLFYYSTSYEWKDLLVFALLILISIFSTRAKSYGFIFIGITLPVLYKLGYRFRFSINSILIISLLIIGICFVAWEKISLYLLYGSSGDTEMFARPALYYVAGLILLDYFPLGCGFGTYATFSSGETYSPIYTKYYLNHVFGLTPEDPAFISDTFYPSLAQFGFIGIVLFIYFWIWVLQKNKIEYIKNLITKKSYIGTVLILFFFLIESVADSTFTHNRGMYMLTLMAMFLTPQYKNS